MAVITKGVQLWCLQAGGDKLPITTTEDDAKGQLLPGLMEFGDITSTVGGAAQRDKIEVTTLADDRHMFVDGLIAEEDEASEIEFKFLFNQDLFNGIDHLYYDISNPTWTLDIPVGEGKYATFAFEASATATMTGAGVGEAITMSVVLKPSSTIRFTRAN